MKHKVTAPDCSIKGEASGVALAFAGGCSAFISGQTLDLLQHIAYRVDINSWIKEGCHRDMDKSVLQR